MDLTGPNAGAQVSGGFPPRLWERVSHAPHRLLMLDHDGTLARFELIRARALPSRETLDSLRRIAETPTTTLVVVSGRPVRELADLLHRPPWTLVGEHGWEYVDPGERIVRHPLPRGAPARLDRAERLVRDAGLGERIERKRASIAVHTRGLSDAHAREVHVTAVRAWTPVLEKAPLRLTAFNGGVELRVRGRDKGTTARDLLAREAPGTLGIHVGDDDTDEDAFRALQGLGVTFRIGPADQPTSARRRLRDVSAVEAMLRWLAARS